MELHDAVTMFCTETFVDAFDSGITFRGKVNPFAEVSNSGPASQRRILETPVAEVIPTERVVISPAGEKFLVADVNIDFWRGTAVRYKYPILPVDVMGSVGTIGETLAGTQSDQHVYAYPYFVRRESDEEEQSDFFSGYEVSFTRQKDFERSSVLSLDGRYYRLKTDSWVDGAGFRVAQAVLLEDPMQTLSAVVNGTVYDSVTDSYTAASAVDVDCFVEPLRVDYEFVSPAFVDIKQGDKAISILKTDLTVKVNDAIGAFKVLSVRDKETWWTCHGRNING